MMEPYNLIVAGGGLSGVAAAVSAAREGFRVLLLEKNGCLGGAMSNNLVYPFMKYWTTNLTDDTKQYLSAGIFAEMREKAQQFDVSYSDTAFDPEYFKLVLDDMMAASGAHVLFHSVVCEVQTENNHIKSVCALTPSGVLHFTADFFIDATGNGDLFALAGCDFQLGRERDGLCQPMTTCFRLSGVDTALYQKERHLLQEQYRKAQLEGNITNPREDILTFQGIGNGILHFNTTRIIKRNPTNVFDLSAAETEARRQVFEMVRFLKKHSKAFANSTIISIASEIGVRESRKLKGVHILTQEELKNSVDFKDTIALGNYDIDIHNPEGAGTSHYYFKDGQYYKIPYRALLPKEYDNLLVAGRCISATHEAQASIRIMPICACLGEAAGTAAVVAYHSGKTAHTVDVNAVRKKLRENGAAL